MIFFRWHIGVARYAACSANPFIRFVGNSPFVFVKYHILLYPFIAFIHTVSMTDKPVFPFLYGRAFILSWSFLLSPAIGFIRCEGRQSRLIRRFEVYFLQILPFGERVIGRKNRRMKLYRQPEPASIKPQRRFGRKGPTRGKIKKRVINKLNF